MGGAYHLWGGTCYLLAIFMILDDIKDYFGIHIGMYFAFLGHYTISLALPAAVGVIVWLYSGTHQVLSSYGYVSQHASLMSQVTTSWILAVAIFNNSCFV